MNVQNSVSPNTLVHTECMTKLLRHMNDVSVPTPPADTIFVSDERNMMHNPGPYENFVCNEMISQSEIQPVIVVNMQYEDQQRPHLGEEEIQRILQTNNQTSVYDPPKRKMKDFVPLDNKRIRTEFEPFYIDTTISPCSPNLEKQALGLIMNSLQQGALTPNSIFNSVRDQLQCNENDSVFDKETVIVPDDEPIAKPAKKKPKKQQQDKEFKYLVNMGRRPRKNKKVEPEDLFMTKFSLRS